MSRRLLVFVGVLAAYGVFMLLYIYGVFSTRNNSNSQLINRWMNIAVAIKTGEKLAHDRLPSQTKTFLKDAINIIFIGDKEMTVVDTKVVDLLENLYADGALSVGNKPKNQVDDKPGWKEDAHKNLPGFKLLYTRFPDKDWYVMIDDDTYILVDALQQKLKQFNTDEPHFFGN